MRTDSFAALWSSDEGQFHWFDAPSRRRHHMVIVSSDLTSTISTRLIIDAIIQTCVGQTGPTQIPHRYLEYGCNDVGFW